MTTQSGIWLLYLDGTMRRMDRPLGNSEPIPESILLAEFACVGGPITPRTFKRERWLHPRNVDQAIGSPWPHIEPLYLLREVAT